MGRAIGALATITREGQPGGNLTGLESCLFGEDSNKYSLPAFRQQWVRNRAHVSPQRAVLIAALMWGVRNG